MTNAVERLRSELQTLMPAERAELARFLIQSLEEDHEDVDAELAWEQELARRADEIHNGREKGEPAEEVFTRLRARHAPSTAR